MITTSDEDIPALEDMPYLMEHWFDLNIILHNSLINSNM